MCFLKPYFLYRIYTGKEVNTYLLLINSVLITIQWVLGKPWNRRTFFPLIFFSCQNYITNRSELLTEVSYIAFLTHVGMLSQEETPGVSVACSVRKEMYREAPVLPLTIKWLRLKEQNDDTHGNVKQKKVNFKVWSQALLLSSSEYLINKNVFPAKTSCNKMFYCITTDRTTK